MSTSTTTATSPRLVYIEESFAHSAQLPTQAAHEWTAPELVALHSTKRRALVAEFVAATYDVAPEGSTSPWSPTVEELTSAYAAFLNDASPAKLALVRDAREDIGGVSKRSIRDRGAVRVQGRFIDGLLIRRSAAPLES
jgi:hypothetical protein